MAEGFPIYPGQFGSDVANTLLSAKSLIPVDLVISITPTEDTLNIPIVKSINIGPFNSAILITTSVQLEGHGASRYTLMNQMIIPITPNMDIQIAGQCAYGSGLSTMFLTKLKQTNENLHRYVYTTNTEFCIELIPYRTYNSNYGISIGGIIAVLD